jgi:hypothetical protein
MCRGPKPCYWLLGSMVEGESGAGMMIKVLQVALLISLPWLYLGECQKAAAQPAEQMQFSVVKVPGVTQQEADTIYIYASGVIDPDAASRFQTLVADSKFPAGSNVFFNSPGGNLLAGINLGRQIRADGFYTYVNAANGMDSYGTPSRKAGLCASACTLAFLGGRFRYIDANSVYAVHRFYSPTAETDGVDIAQILSAAIVQYMRDMGVDPGLFTLMTEGGRTDVVIPTREQLLALNVVNNGAEKSVWTIESIPQGIYLKGEQNTIWGDNKLLFSCVPNKTIEIMAIFPTRGREELIRDEGADGLLIDGNVVRIAANAAKFLGFKNGTAAVLFTLDASLMKRVLAAHTIGASMQFAYDAPTFDGVADFDFSGGLQKIGGLITDCH